MSSANSASSKMATEQKNRQEKINQRMAKITHKLIIISGKGGVGKSTVAVNLAWSLLSFGKKIGLLDTDIHGPSLAKMLGIEKRPLGTSGGFIEPIFLRPNFKIVSMAFLLEDADTPVIWRGPLKMKLISQFLGDVNWGQLDYLIIDSPPGTGDEPLSVIQLIPDLDGAIVVTTPQEVALLDSRKSVNFAKALKLPVIGIIENMSGLICPHCGQMIDLFKKGGGEKASRELDVPFLGRIPIEPAIVESTDKGKPFVASTNKSKSVQAIREIVQKVQWSIEK